MAKVSELFKREYLKKQHFLNEDGLLDPLIFKIARVRVGEMTHYGDKTPAVFLYNEEGVETVIRNKINAFRAQIVLGDEVNEWPGKSVRLYYDPMVTNSRDERVGGIRIDDTYTPN